MEIFASVLVLKTCEQRWKETKELEMGMEVSRSLLGIPKEASLGWNIQEGAFHDGY